LSAIFAASNPGTLRTSSKFLNFPCCSRQDTINWTFAQYELLRQTVAPFEDAGFATWTDAIARPIDDKAVQIK
jgi:hypothetical protein